MTESDVNVKRLYFLLTEVFCFLLLLFVSTASFAEGSKDLYPAGAQGGRAFLISTTKASDVNPFPTLGAHFVYVKKGEWISMASSIQGLGGSTDKRILLFDPDGNSITLNFSGNAGNIPNRTAELAGATFPGQASVGDRYKAVYYQAQMDGIYEVHFLGNASSKTNVIDNYSADGNWIQKDNQRDIVAWDVSVCDKNETSWIRGRVYVYVVNFRIHAAAKSNYKGGFYGKFKILTNDGYVYNVDNNGMNGIYFTFMVNNRGFHMPGQEEAALYKSINLKSVPNSEKRQYTADRYHDPRSPDDSTTATDKIFYNLPDGNMPDSAIGGQKPGNNTWLRLAPQTLEVTNVSFTGAEGSPNQMGQAKGGYINFKSSIVGGYSIILKPSPGSPPFTPRVLTGGAVKGENKVYFDGKDGDGNPLSAGQMKLKIQMDVRFAEVHFPFIDVEINPYGIIIELLKNDLSGVKSDNVYWDDSDIPTVDESDYGPMVNPIVNMDGVSSNQNGHKWGSETSPNPKGGTTFGDKNGMDTWTYLEANTNSTPEITIDVKSADLKISGIISDKDSVKLGDHVHYIVKAANDGPGDITGSAFTFTLPTGFKDLGNVTFDGNGCGTEDVPVSYNPLTDTYSSSLNLPAGCEVNYQVETEITGTAKAGNQKVEATILRTKDISDPDATNLALKDENGNTYEPTDAHIEVANNGQDGVSNNILTYGVKVLVNIKGNLFHDANGLADSRIDNGSSPGDNLGLNVVLLDKNADTVVEVAPVNVADGSYLLTGVSAGDYTLVLTKDNPEVGSAAVYVSDLPEGWTNTGEYLGTGTGDDGTADGQLNVQVISSRDISDANFGIEKSPIAGNGKMNGGINPRKGTAVTVVPNTFSNNVAGSDPDGTVTSIRMIHFPENADAVTVDHVEYNKNNFPSDGIIIPSDGKGNPNQEIKVSPSFDGSGNIKIYFLTIDNADKESADTGTAEIAFTALRISGNIFNDINGLTDGTVNGTGTNAGGLNAVLYYHGEDTVVAAAAADASGEYYFPDLSIGFYDVILTTAMPATGQAIPPVILPAGWVSTGEHFGQSAGEDGIADGVLYLNKIISDVADVNFGIEQLPEAGEGRIDIVNPDNNQAVAVSNEVFTNIKPGNDVAPGEINAVLIKDFPADVKEITIDGVTYSPYTWPAEGVSMPSDATGKPAVSLKAAPGFQGMKDVAIAFYAVDNAKKESAAPGLATIHFSVTHSISGTVFYDADGLSNNEVDGNIIGGNLGLKMVLVTNEGAVSAVSPVDIPTGMYHFTNISNGDYTLILTTANPAVGTNAPSPNPPDGWKYMGEHLGTDPGDDGSVDGRLNVHVEDKNVENANFGISQADNKFFIPNTFTPNGDGLNDIWEIFGNNIKDINVMVYNQYGQMIFTSKDVSTGWDGKNKGVEQPVGVYIYIAKLSFYDGNTVTKKGSITLIR